MKLISSLIVCLALSACATDYSAQLTEPNYGRHGGLSFSEATLDPAMLMNGTYASKQMNGSYGSTPFGAFCLAGGCSQQAPLWSSGWAP
jgi:hypothetical protein